MSMYNLVFGENDMADMILATLGLTKHDVGRFRDCFVSDGKIAVYTRNGGGNRQYHMPDFSNHPQYAFDCDDDFDDTYATIYFNFPDESAELLKKLDSGERFDPDQRWLDAIATLKKSATPTGHRRGG